MKRSQVLAMLMAAAVTLNSTGISAMATETAPTGQEAVVQVEEPTEGGTADDASAEDGSSTDAENAGGTDENAGQVTEPADPGQGDAGSTEGAENGNTENGNAEGAESGTTEDAAAEGTTDVENPDDAADAGNTDAADAENTDAAGAATTEAAEVDATETDETAAEEDAEESAFPEFPGMEDGYQLSTQELEDKAVLEEHLDDIDAEADEDGQYVDAEGIYVTGQVVYLADSEEQAEAVAEAYGGELISYSYGVAVIALAEDVPVSKALAAAADEDMLLPAVWPNYYYELFDEVESEDEDVEEQDASAFRSSSGDWYNDPALAEDDENYQWQHDYIGDSYAWAAGYTGQGIEVAVIDSGIYADHEDLKGNVLPGTNCATGAKDKTYNTDTGGHGTHVAGIIAAEAGNNLGGAGIAPDAKVAAYHLEADLSDQKIAGNELMSAINAARTDSRDIINMSLGGYYYDDNMATVVKRAYNAGIAVFVAAGNEATNATSYPAGYPGAISVAAIDETGAKASFTNYGSTVDLAFPGVNIYSTVSPVAEDYQDIYYTYMSGTSMATPAAAGTAAVILSARADIRGLSGSDRVDALLKVMKQNVTKCSDSGMGAGTTYLPKALGLKTSTEAPAVPTITIDGDYNTKGKYYANESVTATITTTSQDALEIYYSTDGKRPTYKNGVVTNGIRLDAEVRGAQYSGEVELTGKQKVTLNVLAVNTVSGMTSKVATQAVTLKPTPSDVEITQANGVDSIAAGSKVTLKATVLPSYSISTKVQWSVDAEAAAAGIKVSNGTVSTTAKTPTGSYNITATAVGADGKTYDGVSSEPYTIQVIGKVQVKTFKLTQTKAALNLTTNKSIDLAPYVNIVTNPVGQQAPDIVWSSSNPAIAAVDANTGEVTAISKGKATITAMLNDGSNKKATCAVTVNSLVTGITVSGPDKVAVGKSITLTATVTPADVNNKKVTWSVTGGNGLITISNGRLTAKKGASGSCTVTATAADGSNVTSNAYSVTVVQGAITGITLSSKTLTLFKTSNGNAGQASATATLRATVAGTGANASAVQFTSSAPGIVAVEGKGNTATLTAKAPGKATITCAATDGSGKKATCTVNVNIPMSRIAVTPTKGYTGEIAQGKSIQLTYRYGTSYGTPTNKKVVWSSDNSDVTVNQSGRVTVKKSAPLYTKGEGDLYQDNVATITATAADGSGVAGYYVVTVTPVYKKVEIVDNSWYDEGDQKWYGGDGLLVYAEASDGYYYQLTNFDTQFSGGTNAACDVSNSGVIFPVPGKVTYTKSTALPDSIEIRYTQKMTVTVTLKDGSNLKKSASMYVARNLKNEIQIYGLR